MNAKKLANEFKSNAPASQIFDWCHKAQDMLRKQQDVNAALAQQYLSSQGYVVRLEAEILSLKEKLDTSDKAYLWLEEMLYEYKRKRDPEEIDELIQAQIDNEQFFKDLKSGKISLKPKAQG